MIKPTSKFNEGPYINKFGSWRKALESFVEEMNSLDVPTNDNLKTNEVTNKHRTARDINWRLRYLVMRRDNFKCIKCGDPRQLTSELFYILIIRKHGQTEVKQF